MPNLPAGGLYAITDDQLISPERFVETVAAVLRGGAAMVQYRSKSSDPHLRRRRGAELAALCHTAGAPLIINDDIALATAVGAAGVHLGRADADAASARAQAGPGTLIGVSCYNSLQRAEQAVEQGADYVAFGRFFASRTKPLAVHAKPALLSRARARLSVPIVAIGGITPENGGRLIQAGADFLAVIHGLFGQTDPEAAARGYRALFSRDALF